MIPKNTVLTATPVGSESELTRNLLSGIDVQTANVYTGSSSYVEHIPEESVDITIGVFMDGTLNNRGNSNARMAYEKAINPIHIPLTESEQEYHNFRRDTPAGERGSYENDHSNVARMEPAYKKITSGKQLQDRVYIEGIGSVTGGRDDEDGMGLGEGPTGVPKKVEKACIDAARKANALLSNSNVEKINMLQIDVFGFSRGAAAARNFVHELTRRIGDERTVFDGDDEAEGDAKDGENYEVDYGEFGVQLGSEVVAKIRRFVVRFVGLYETVASYGMVHYNDTGDLNLDAIKTPDKDDPNRSIYNTRHVFQLVAQDEHRENFVITNIDSANGVEKFIPGVHSDIGGSYTDNAKEVDSEGNDLIIKEPSAWSWNDRENAEAMRTQLINESWYRPNELLIDDDDNLRVHRTVVSKKYSFIPLHIMAEYAMKKKLLFEFSKIGNKYDLSETASVVLSGGINYSTDLQSIKNRLDKHVYEEQEPMSLVNSDDEKMLRLIRTNYIHTSAHYSNQIKIKGIWYAPHQPHDSYLTREREENDG